MPSSRQARRIRSAISPRVAMTIFSIMSGLFEDEQWLAEFNRVAVLRHDRGDASGLVGFDLVHHLHRLDDAQHLPDLDLVAYLDEGLGAWGGRGVEGPHHRGGDHVLAGLRFRGRAPGRRECKGRCGERIAGAGGGGGRAEPDQMRELGSGACAGGRHAADAYRLLAFLDLDFRDARLLEELDQLLYLSDIHAGPALENRKLRKIPPAQAGRASRSAAARTAA